MNQVRRVVVTVFLQREWNVDKGCHHGLTTGGRDEIGSDGWAIPRLGEVRVINVIAFKRKMLFARHDFDAVTVYTA